MAEIPVKEKSSMNWLWILLALLGLAALLYFLFAAGDDEEVATAEPVEAVETMETPVAAAYTVGETVTLDGVRVTELTGDMSFRVDNNGTDTFVVFDEQPTPDTAQEGAFDINVGQLVNLTGTVMAGDAAMPDGVDATVPTGMNSYIYATDMTVAERAE